MFFKHENTHLFGLFIFINFCFLPVNTVHFIENIPSSMVNIEPNLVYFYITKFTVPVGFTFFDVSKLILTLPFFENIY